MNRIELPTECPPTSTSFTGSDDSYTIDSTRFGSRRVAADQRVPHATFLPMHYEPGYAYPLVVWLHGSPGNEFELRQIMPKVSMRNYVAVAPRGPSEVRRVANGFQWRQTGDDIEEAEARIDECVEFARRRYNIHTERIFLAGYGGGGTMAVRAAWNHPEKYSGAATIGGPLPTRFCPLRQVNRMRSLPCLLAMARGSRMYPDEQVCRDLRLLHSAGCTVALRQYPNGDELTTNMLSDLNCWLMEFVCGGGQTC